MFSLVPGMSGTKASKASALTFKSSVVFGATKELTLTRRTRPVAAIDSGEICVPFCPMVCTPVHESSEKRMPPSPSGNPLSRWTGRTAAIAISKVTGYAFTVLLMRSCGVRA